MKTINFNISKSDVETLLFSLSVLPSIVLEEVNNIQHEINTSCCLSSSEKLIHRNTDFIPNEIRVMYLSLKAVQLINIGELDCDIDTKKDCSKYIFTVNKLIAYFESIFPQYFS